VGLFESRRRLVQYLRARDEEKAVAEITAHLKRIHRYILRQEKLKTI
jgi:DNA-binding GntR family transcriptional regulator